MKDAYTITTITLSITLSFIIVMVFLWIYKIRKPAYEKDFKNHVLPIVEAYWKKNVLKVVTTTTKTENAVVGIRPKVGDVDGGVII